MARPGVTGLRILDRNGQVALDYAFDEEGRVAHVDLPMQGASGVTRDSFTWDAEGRVLTETRATGPTADELVTVETATYTYDEAGHRVASTIQDAEGGTTAGPTWTWEGDCMVAWTPPGEDNPARTVGCDEAGQVTSLEALDGPGGAFRWEYAWSEGATGPDSRAEYDPETDALRGTLTYTYTATGALESEAASSGQPTRLYVYDADGTVIEEQDVTAGESSTRSTWQVRCD